MSRDIHELSATELLAAYRSRDLSRREVVAAHLARIDEINDAVNGVIYRFDERALREAEEADRRAADREDLLLDGVPVLVSDWYHVEGVPQPMGVRAWAESVDDADDPVVQRVRGAGAIILGKSSVPEFYIRWNAVSELFGETRNARDLGCSAGGSGGGAATAVAGGIVPIAFHADLGGSLRVPASFCGIIALRPSGGVVPLAYPVEPSMVWEAWTSCGPMARSVEDAWLALRAVAGPHPSVPNTVPLALPETLATDGPRPRVARIVDATGATVTDEIRREVDRTAAALTEAGYEVVDAAAPPRLERLAQLWIELLGTELMHCVMPAVRGTIGESARQHIDTLYGQFDLGRDLAPFIAAEQELRSIAREVSEWMDEYPLVLAPVAGMARPPIDFDYFLSEQQSVELFDHMRSVVWVNALALPGVALGNGAQIVGRRFRDAEPAVAAARVMQALGSVTVAEPALA